MESDSLIAWSTVALAVSTFLLFAFTAALWRVTYTLSKDARDASSRQSAEMKESIAHAQRAALAMEAVASATKNNAVLMQEVLHKQMRAYVTVEVGKAIYQDESNVFEATPLLENTGFTPARNVTYRIRAGILPRLLPEDYLFDEPAEEIRNDASIAPRQKLVITALVEETFSKDDAQDIRAGRDRRLYVWGSATYSDVFGGGPWRTNFCQSIYWQHIGGELRWFTNYHQTHNDAT